jgi:hypothetical protein
MTLNVRSSSVWRGIADVYVKVSGVWRTIQQGWIKQSGVWRNFYVAAEPAEYVIFGGDSAPTTGTLTDLSGYTTIKIGGVAAGGNGTPNHPGGCCPGTGAGGGGAANIRGNSFPVPGNSISSIYYEVGGTGTSGDTYVKINGPSGTDLIRFVAGSPNPNQTAGAGGPSAGGGPNCIAGSPGAPGADRYGNGPAAGPSSDGGTAGGGGSGGAVDNFRPGTTGGSGGSSSFSFSAPTLMTTIGTGPAPTTWSIGPGGPHAGGGGGYGSTSNTTNGTNAGSVLWAEGGGGSGVYAPPGSGNPGSGGAGAGIRWNDPSNPTNNGKFFGGGGGGLGSSVNPQNGKGGKGFLIIQLLTS